jgi:uncharacterized membrane protein YraQ (UPF0718 family)
MSAFADFIANFFFLFTEAAPFLLIGLLLAGVIQTLIPKQWIEKALGKDASVATAAVIGAPIPLCSCSVIPTAMGIRRAGASKASTASFMVATPETGVDSVGVTLALMGPVMAIIRPVAAIGSAITAGLLVRWWDTETPPKAEPVVKSCCSGNGCNTQAPAEPALKEKLKTAVHYGFGKLLADFMNWLLIGLFFAALVQTFVPPSFFAQYGSGIFAMIAMVVISIPMYICATASTPIAVGLMLSGISPGAALVFMMAGPATNIATLMVIKNELGMRSLVAYLTGVIGSAIAFGLLTDAFLSAQAINIQVNTGEHSHLLETLYTASAALLAGLMGNLYLQQWKNRTQIASAS